MELCNEAHVHAVTQSQTQPGVPVEEICIESAHAHRNLSIHGFLYPYVSPPDEKEVAPRRTIPVPKKYLVNIVDDGCCVMCMRGLTIK